MSSRTLGASLAAVYTGNKPADRAFAGAGHLDRHQPGWAHRVDLDRLSFAVWTDPTAPRDADIMGQLFAGCLQTAGVNSFDRAVDLGLVVPHGVSDVEVQQLTQAWAGHVHLRQAGCGGPTVSGSPARPEGEPAAPITFMDVVLEAAVEQVEAQLTGATPAPVMPRHQPVLADDGWPKFCIDELDLETPGERAFRQAVEVARTHDRLDRVADSVNVAAAQATTDADRMADLLGDVLDELREANRLAGRSWWQRLRGAR